MLLKYNHLSAIFKMYIINNKYTLYYYKTITIKNVLLMYIKNKKNNNSNITKMVIFISLNYFGKPSEFLIYKSILLKSIVHIIYYYGLEYTAVYTTINNNYHRERTIVRILLSI